MLFYNFTITQGALTVEIRMRASTAAPAFVARRLMQLLAFCDRRIVGRSFDCFLQFLAVLSSSWLLSELLDCALQFANSRSEFGCLHFCLSLALAHF